MDGSDRESGVGADADAVDAARVVDDLDRPVVLYDGVCNLCNAVVRVLIRRDDAGVFRLAPLQSAVGRELLTRHDLPTEEFDSFVLVEDGEAYTRSTAALRVAGRLDAPWSWLAVLRRLPAWLRDPAYDLVARVRYRVFGKTEECQLPPPELRDRFVERSLDLD